MSDKPKNPQAFPKSAKDIQGATFQASPELGMTLRDYFAGQILTGGGMVSDTGLHEQYARIAYAMADAMLKERGKTND